LFAAINIGNTNTAFGVFQKEILQAQDRAATIQRKDEGALRVQMDSFLKKIDVEPSEIEGAGIASVVPDLTGAYAAIAQSYFGTKPMIVGPSLDLGIRIHYADPNELGADRLCSAVAGYVKYGGPLIIIDFGTATTYNVVASNGDFLGGVIAPGIGTSALSLHSRAAQLPNVDLRLPKNVIGSDTMSSMQSGILLGSVDAMEGMVKRIQEELRQRETKAAAVIATGGFSEFVRKQTGAIQYVEPALVLDGIRLIYARVNRREKSRQSL
jgi:type III pantothenate kinase